jgi:hypothetical protein
MMVNEQKENKEKTKRVITMRKIGDFVHYHQILVINVYLTALLLLFFFAETFFDFMLRVVGMIPTREINARLKRKSSL